MQREPGAIHLDPRPFTMREVFPDDLLAVVLRIKDIHGISQLCLQHDLAQTPVCDEAIEMFAKRLADASFAILQKHRGALAARLDELLERWDASRMETRRTVGAEQ